MSILFTPGARSVGKWFNDIEGPEANNENHQVKSGAQPGFSTAISREIVGLFVPMFETQRSWKDYFLLCFDIHIWRDNINSTHAKL